MKLLTICPSRIRPHRLKEMLDSFYATKSPWTEIIVYVAEDDPKVDDYRNLKCKSLIFGKRRNIASVFNYCFSLYPDFEYYQEINDDHIYRTKLWDELLINEIEENGFWGMAFGWDVLHPKDHMLPSGVIISGNIPKTLGYIVHPIFEHLFIDNYFKDIAEGIGKLFKNLDVVIEHNHYIGGKVDFDDNYLFVSSPQNFEDARKKYNIWQSEYKEEEIGKLKKEMKRGEYVSI